MTEHQVYLGLGSNIRPQHFLPLGLDELNSRFGAMDVSCTYLSTAIGFEGPDFHNLVVGIVTTHRLNELSQILRALEYQHGRDLNCTKFSSRTLDIDLLTYDDREGQFEDIVLPRKEITENAFVLRPFAEIAPDLVLPGQTQNLAALWQKYDATNQSLTPVALDWHGTRLPMLALRAKFQSEQPLATQHSLG